MTSHIPKCSCSKSPPSAPVKRNKIIDIINILRSAQPQIPLQFFRNGRMLFGPRNSLGPHRAIGPVVHSMYITDQSCFKPLSHCTHAFTRCTLVTHLCNYFIPVSYTHLRAHETP